jgi:hypothetical protein
MRHDDDVLEPTFRPLITIIRLTPDRSSVEVALDMDGRLATGFGTITDDDSMGAACRGTIAAVQGLLPDQLSLELEWYQMVDRGDEAAVVNSAVSLRVEGNSRVEHLIGAAYVRHDVDVAAVRATLDGLTRRLVSYMFD